MSAGLCGECWRVFGGGFVALVGEHVAFLVAVSDYLVYEMEDCVVEERED